MVSKLLELGADPNGEGKINRSVLLMAAQQFETLKAAEDYKETVQALVSAGAKIDPMAIENLQELLEKSDLVEIVRIQGYS